MNHGAPAKRNRKQGLSVGCSTTAASAAEVGHNGGSWADDERRGPALHLGGPGGRGIHALAIDPDDTQHGARAQTCLGE